MSNTVIYPFGVDGYLPISGGVFPTSAKLYLIDVLSHVAWTDNNGQSYLDILQAVLLDNASITAINAVFNPNGATIYDSMEVELLRNYLNVTATLSNGDTTNVFGYTLTGTLTAGTNTLMVSFMGLTTTFQVTAVHSLSGKFPTWTFAPSDGISRYNDNKIELLCGNATDLSGWYVWAADVKTTLWSAVEGKTVRIRYKVNDTTAGVYGVGIYQNSSITSLSTSLTRRVTLNGSLSSDGYYEADFVCDTENFTAGTLIPNENSTFGLFCYSRSMNNYAYIYDVQIFEIS